MRTIHLFKVCGFVVLASHHLVDALPTSPSSHDTLSKRADTTYCDSRNLAALTYSVDEMKEMVSSSRVVGIHEKQQYQ